MQKVDFSAIYDAPAVTLRGHVPEGKGKGALLVLPGGGYQLCAYPEGEPVAAHFAEMGYAAFTLEYSVCGEVNPRAVFPGPLREAAQAVKHLRAHADELGIDPERIYLFGASAGGHLAAAYGSCWRDAALLGDIADAETLRPNALVLLYCASELDDYSMMLPSICGHAAPFTQEEIGRWIIKDRLNADFPPAVLFHSAPDPMVPVQQSLDLFAALQEKEIPGELHVFGGGEHAYGLGTGTPAEVWPELADRFLREVHDAPENFSRETMRLARLRRKGLN